MELHIVATYDKAAAAYMRPFFVPSLGLAIRSFEDEVKRVDPNNPLNSHPSDFQLYQLGRFDDISGEFTNVKPNVLCTGDQLALTV